jgi:hypothetical protein
LSLFVVAGLRRGPLAVGGGGGAEGIDSVILDRLIGCVAIEDCAGDVPLKEEAVFEKTVK